MEAGSIFSPSVLHLHRASIRTSDGSGGRNCKNTFGKYFPSYDSEAICENGLTFEDTGTDSQSVFQNVKSYIKEEEKLELQHQRIE